jgi:RNA polymerase sigma factor (sigma-70 family)
MLHVPSSAPRNAGLDAAESVEARLLARIAGGELQAFETLYRAYHPRLCRFLDRITRRPALVEEVLNDTMLVVWQHADRYNGRCKVSTWIFAIAYRKALKWLRRWDDAVEATSDEVAAAETGPEQQADRHSVQIVLRNALARLSAEQRAVVDLTYFHGIGYREIAQIIECPVDTVRTRMFHARRRLRALLPGRLEDWL